MTFDWPFFWTNLLTPNADFIEGLWVTIGISVVAMVLSLLLGVLIALLLRSRNIVLRTIGNIYIWVIRGTPLLVQLVIVYSGLAAAGIYRFNDITAGAFTIQAVIQAAIVTLTIHEAAYIAEIVRSGISSVDTGQFEASEVLALKPHHTMLTIVLPQAVRTMIPPLGNIFNQLMKETSVLSIIGVSEMFLVAQGFSAATFRTFEIFLVAALYYLVLTTVWTLIQGLIENRLDKYMGIDSQQGVLSRIVELLVPSRRANRPGVISPISVNDQARTAV
ncbi:amino acid ABC transporter permease [Brevibacterium aurantiacum]|uniref:Amino acid ABC transporter permease n=1 Tax=Brevibacterium aurantiacum TaxID=273384 RepID=A0A556CMD3_BREAU|nr:amino acid ABC transporter permease [Brevibacterium aurantiacum]TSI18591.1 amino acid ABC transporter permease [Brevibacterium aurantiacum]